MKQGLLHTRTYSENVGELHFAKADKLDPPLVGVVKRLRSQQLGVGEAMGKCYFL